MSLSILRGSAEAPLEPLIHRTVALVGYGNQGRAHAQNLRDSGVRVVVGARMGRQASQQATADGFDTVSVEDAVAAGDMVILAIPDEVQPGVFQESIAPHLRIGAVVGFLHGFAVRHGLIAAPGGVGLVMVAPKGPGSTLRGRFIDGQGIPCLFAVGQESVDDQARLLGLAWANGIGCARAGIILTTFEQETDTDLFGEQAVLCGGMTQLAVAAFEILVEAGYPEELAYLECCHEIKQVADLMYERGLSGMMKAISNTAEFGAYLAGPMLIDHDVRARMKSLLDSIQDGSFAAAFMRDHEQGWPLFKQHRASLQEHAIEHAGAQVRRLMPWLGQHGKPFKDIKDASS